MTYCLLIIMSLIGSKNKTQIGYVSGSQRFSVSPSQALDTAISFLMQITKSVLKKTLIFVGDQYFQSLK